MHRVFRIAIYDHRALFFEVDRSKRINCVQSHAGWAHSIEPIEYMLRVVGVPESFGAAHFKLTMTQFEHVFSLSKWNSFLDEFVMQFKTDHMYDATRNVAWVEQPRVCEYVYRAIVAIVIAGKAEDRSCFLISIVQMILPLSMQQSLFMFIHSHEPLPTGITIRPLPTANSEKLSFPTVINNIGRLHDITFDMEKYVLLSVSSCLQINSSSQRSECFAEKFCSFHIAIYGCSYILYIV